MNFFWPTRLKLAPGLLARLGRVLHWLSIPLAIFLAVLGLSRPVDEWLTTEIWGAVTAYLFGRGLRYLLAGE
jgi:hypothetical protein